MEISIIKKLGSPIDDEIITCKQVLREIFVD